MIALLCSCGDLITFDEEAVPATTLALDRTQLTMMEGDQAQLFAIFTPADISNNRVYWTSDDEAVVSIADDVLHAETAGETTVTAISVSERLTASCRVTVLPRWQLNLEMNDWPFDMVIYADAFVAGVPFDPATMTIAAFNEDDEVCGIAENRVDHGITYTVIRVWSPYTDGEVISFRCFDHVGHYMTTCSNTIVFDGEAHGTLSRPYYMMFQ